MVMKEDATRGAKTSEEVAKVNLFHVIASLARPDSSPDLSALPSLQFVHQNISNRASH